MDPVSAALGGGGISAESSAASDGFFKGGDIVTGDVIFSPSRVPRLARSQVTGNPAIAGVSLPMAVLIGGGLIAGVMLWKRR